MWSGGRLGKGDRQWPLVTTELPPPNHWRHSSCATANSAALARGYHAPIQSMVRRYAPLPAAAYFEYCTDARLRARGRMTGSTVHGTNGARRAGAGFRIRIRYITRMTRCYRTLLKFGLLLPKGGNGLYHWRHSCLTLRHRRALEGTEGPPG
eukprot:COSAG02_NODE_5125_length_4609_cov_3.134590_1_plen_152_part_00